MGLVNPFAQAGRWYRGIFHCHTTNSDGGRSVDTLVAWYGEQGYDFVAITDHNQLTPPPAGGRARPLLVPGTEVDVGRSRAGQPYHLVGIGLREMVDLPRDVAARYRLPVQDVIGALRRAGAVVFVAHPYWSGLVLDDLLPLEGIAGIEVFNANTEIEIGKGYSGVHWDDCLSLGKPLLGAANDDAHWRLRDFGQAWTMLRAETLTPEAVVGALGAGAFYGSTGPVLDDVTFDGQTATVRIAPPGAAEVRFACDHRWGRRVVADGSPLTSATYALLGREKFLRVEVTGPSGGRAWTNPLFLAR
ncbi:MAG TPA: CehA/McbA family metallohydrolase [bacterium]|nr:CehA/McbA family metallohydrolase [bacterium]